MNFQKLLNKHAKLCLNLFAFKLTKGAIDFERATNWMDVFEQKGLLL